MFGIKDEDRFRAIYAVGKTGTGKSSLLLNIALSDIERGKGIAVLDPHADLSNELLSRIPKERVKDVIYFNVEDTEYPVAFNPLSDIHDDIRYTTVATLVSALKNIFSHSWGERMEHILRYTLLTLSYYSKSTLLDIVPVLTNPDFRKQVLYAVPDPSVHQFWQREFEPLSPGIKNEFIAPILNKVSLFSAHPVIRNILGQVESRINIEQTMDTKKIFIANLSKAVLGEAGTKLIGSLLVTQFQMAAMRRANKPMEMRVPFYLFIDEMQSFITLSFIGILSECRKYKLGLYITNQYLTQLPEEIQDAILGNIGTLIAFRVGSGDAKLLADREFYPVFSQTDLIELPKFYIYLKLLIDGTASKPFSAVTLPNKASVTSHKDEIVALSRNKYGLRKRELGNYSTEPTVDRDEEKNTLFEVITG